jgi:hypothetical protein
MVRGYKQLFDFYFAFLQLVYKRSFYLPINCKLFVYIELDYTKCSFRFHIGGCIYTLLNKPFSLAIASPVTNGSEIM